MSQEPSEDPVYQELASSTPVWINAPSAAPFPNGTLPPWVSAFSDHQSIALQVPVDLVSLAVLGTMAAAIAPRVRVRQRSGYEQPVALWVAGIAEPGSRKSEVVKRASAPLHIIERELAEAAVDTAAANEAALKEATARSGLADRELDRAIDAELQASEQDKTAAVERTIECRNRAAEAAANLERVKASARARPRLMMGDATAEAIAVALTEQGAIAILSDEPTIWANIAGRYSTGSSSAPPVEALMQGYSGAPIVMDRRGMEGTRRVDEPALSMVVMAQPTALEGLAANKALTGRGFVDRWLFAQPPSNLGYRDHKAGDDEAINNRHIRDFYETTFATMARKILFGEKIVLELTPEADEEKADWSNRIEKKLLPGEAFRSHPGLVSKRQGDAARIAAVLHVASAVDPDGTMSNRYLEPVGLSSMNKAIEIVEWSLATTLYVIEEQNLDPTSQMLKRTLRWMRNKISPHNPQVTRRAIYQAMRGGDWKRAEDFDSLISELVADNWLAQAPTPNEKGRPSELYWIHPALWTGWV